MTDCPAQRLWTQLSTMWFCFKHWNRNWQRHQLENLLLGINGKQKAEEVPKWAVRAWRCTNTPRHHSWWIEYAIRSQSVYQIPHDDTSSVSWWCACQDVTCPVYHLSAIRALCLLSCLSWPPCTQWSCYCTYLLGNNQVSSVHKSCFVCQVSPNAMPRHQVPSCRRLVVPSNRNTISRLDISSRHQNHPSPCLSFNFPYSHSQ